MTTIIIAKIMIANLFLFLILSAIGVLRGLDLKKWSSWLFALYGFLSGFLMNFLAQDDYENLKLIVNWRVGLPLGTLLAFAAMYTGAMNHWHKQRFRNTSSD